MSTPNADSVPDVLDRDGANATASFLLNDHHAIVPSEDESYCLTCLFAIGWVQPTTLGPDEYGHATQATSAEVQVWRAAHMDSSGGAS